MGLGKIFRNMKASVKLRISHRNISVEIIENLHKITEKGYRIQMFKQPLYLPSILNILVEEKNKNVFIGHNQENLEEFFNLLYKEITTNSELKRILR